MRDVDIDPRLRGLLLVAVLAGHGAVAAVLLLASAERPSWIPPGVLAVKWVGEQKAPEPAPETVVKPRPLPMKPRVQPVPRHQAVSAPAMVEAPAPSAAPATEEAPPVLAAASSGTPQAEPRPLVAPRFDADYLSNPAPVYPATSRAMGEQGKVFLHVFVSPQGDARSVEVHAGSGHQRLDAAAVDAVRRWKFVPARQGGEAVAAWVIVPISFTLRR